MSVSLTVFRFCRDELSGWRLTFPHAWHFRTRTSAQGFLPPLLLFSTMVVQDCPSIRRASQCLQMVCFRAGLSLILVLSEMDRRSLARRRAVAVEIALCCLFDASSSSGSEGCTGCWGGNARYVAACWRNEILEYIGRFWTEVAGFPFAILKYRLSE